MKIRVVSILMMLLFQGNIQAQDLIYSQFYNAPSFLNPALTAQFDGDFRLNAIYRSQWTKMQGTLNSYTFSAEYQLPLLGSGIGLIATKSTEGSAYLSKLNVSGLYSYSIDLNEISTLSFGIQGGLTNRRIDVDKLIFADQLDDKGIINGAGSAASVFVNNKKSFFDSGAGINLVLDQFMLGISAQHLNQPNEALTGQTARLPMRYGLHTSFMISLDRYGEDLPAIIPSLVAYRQDKINTISAGFQFKTNTINFGLWYRGDGKQNDAIVFSLIFDLFKNYDTNSKFRIGLSHDATTSRLNYTNTAGTTEGAVVYESEIPGRSEARYYRTRANNFNRCYKFY